MIEKMKVSSVEPCAICGKPDYCFRLRFENGNTLHYCARVEEETNILSTNNQVYTYIKSKDTNIGTYHVFQLKEEADAFFNKRKTGNIPDYNQQPVVRRPEPGAALIEGERKPAGADRLDSVYRKALELLGLNKKHKEKLKNEWGEELFEKITSHYQVASLPPAGDIVKREGYVGSLKTDREQIALQLSRMFGDISDIPGFYKKEGTYHMAGTEGILFPIYDNEKRIIRLRIREDYPTIKGMFDGSEGYFNHTYSKKGADLWFFKPKDKTDSILVYGAGKNLIKLDANGLPKGKASSKYKNFSSVAEKKIDNKLINSYGYGSRSGSNISIYQSDGDDLTTLWITEGEKKAMVANTILKVPVISLPGTGTFSKLFEGAPSIVDTMLERGLKSVVIAYDADKSVNKNVLTAEMKATQSLLSHDIKVLIGEWNPSWGKGLDDILISGIRPQIYIIN